MHSVFELPHIFVVFQPGAAGNFISGLLTRIITNDPGQLPVSVSGSSHTTIDKKISGTDYMSFGTIAEDRSEFSSEEDRIDFYLTNIKKYYSDIGTPQVVWTHDFLNIPVYKKFFPNSKILIITQDTQQEKLAVMAQSISKNLMDPDANSPLTSVQWDKMNIEWKIGARIELNRIFSRNHELTEHIIENRFKYKDLMAHVLLKMLLNFNGLLPIMGEQTTGNWGDLSDHILSRNPTGIPPQSVGPTYKSFYGTDSVLLPYKCIIDNDIDTVIKLFGTALGKPLSLDQCKFVSDNFINYRNSQNNAILTDTINYYHKLKKLALVEIDVIKNLQLNRTSEFV